MLTLAGETEEELGEELGHLHRRPAVGDVRVLNRPLRTTLSAGSPQQFYHCANPLFVSKMSLHDTPISTAQQLP